MPRPGHVTRRMLSERETDIAEMVRSEVRERPLYCGVVYVRSFVTTTANDDDRRTDRQRNDTSVIYQ